MWKLSVRGQCGASSFVRSVMFEHRALDTQDDRSFASFSLPADMGSKRNSALHDTADTGEEEPPVKIQQVEFSLLASVRCAALATVARTVPHTLLRTRKTPADSSNESQKHDVEDLLRATHCEQLYSKVMSYLGISELIEKLYKERVLSGSEACWREMGSTGVRSRVEGC